MSIQTIKQLGHLIRATRLEQGLSQVALAGAVGVNARFLGDLERGKETCEVGKVLSVILGLGLKVSIINGSAEVVSEG